MRSALAIQEEAQPRSKKSSERGLKKLLVINGSKGVKLPANVAVKFFISQERLARIQELQSRLAYEHNEFMQEWRVLKRQMLGGAEIERGPIRAWLQHSLRVVKRRGRRESKTYTTLKVR
jgi:hypothetical protein